MFLDNAFRPQTLWCGAAGITAGYVGLFLLARRPVSLRLGRLGWLGLTVFGLRLVLLALGRLFADYLDVGLSIVVLLSALKLRWNNHIWLVRMESEEFRRQVQTACRGLFLTCDEPEPGRFRLTAKEDSRELRTRSLSRRVQIVFLPQLAGSGKVTLLVQWLAKQFPGPVPRVRIVLPRSES